MPQNFYLGIDVGGSHITLDLIDAQTFEMLPGSTVREPLDTHQPPTAVLTVFDRAIQACAAKAPPAAAINGIGLAIPGPFTYQEGICRITPAQNKYEQMFSVNFRQHLCHALGGSTPVAFNNDAACFALGEYFRGGAKGFSRPVVITLGTGFGASFLNNGTPQTAGPDVPPDGELWHVPYQNGIADDHFTTRWLVSEWQRLTGQTIAGGKEIAQAALAGDPTARAIYHTFGANLAEFIAPWLTTFNADALVIGGNLARDWDLFIPAFTAALPQPLASALAVNPCQLGEQAPIYGAALALTLIDTATITAPPLPPGAPDTAPILAQLAGHPQARIDGPAALPWKALVNALDNALRAAGQSPVWHDISAATNPDGTLDPANLANIKPDPAAISIVTGPGAAQVPWPAAATITLSL